MFRYAAYLLAPSLRLVGMLLSVLSIAMLLPIGMAWLYDEPTLDRFVTAAAITLASGLFLMVSMRRARRELEARDGFLLVTLTWFVCVVFSAIPLYLTLPQLSIGQIFFEAMSCLTTTGATVISGLDDLPLSINYWRCELSWLGGMGILVLGVAILPFLGVGGVQAFRAESTTLFKDTKLTPRIADTAKALYSLYLILSIVCALAYRWAGMNWDEAVMFMFTTVSLAGTAPYDESIGFFASHAIEYVAVVFMVISGFNFLLHFTAWRQKSLMAYITDIESLGWVASIVFGTTFVFTILAYNDFYPNLRLCFERALFNTVSILSTTGYATDDYAVWPNNIGILLLLGGMIATCAGSTGGGIKISRFLIAVKVAFLNLKRLNRPRAYLPLRLGHMEISSELADNIFTFLMLYCMVVFFATLVLLLDGNDIVTAFSAVLACITNVGPALGNVGPAQNYAYCSEIFLWTCSACMFLGRLELIAVFAVFSPSFWRI
ncbi:MAG TPA: potassium transporter Trk [Sutterella sp.]|nr:potassium transporter Trk [Sutterella sp.]